MYVQSSRLHFTLISGLVLQEQFVGICSFFLTNTLQAERNSLASDYTINVDLLLPIK